MKITEMKLRNGVSEARDIGNAVLEPARFGTGTQTTLSVDQVDRAIQSSLDYLLSVQSKKGYWVFDLETDTTISSEYLLLQRFLNRNISPFLITKMARYIRKRQLPEGGWPIYEGGKSDISASVKAYFALKMAGDSPDAPHMSAARNLILSLGGAAKVNVFTRITLALFGQIPWDTVPAMPVEIMLLPRWFFFHLEKVSYWSRTVIVPLLILMTRKPVCRLSAEEGVQELFSEPVKNVPLDGFDGKNILKDLFILIDRILRKAEPWMSGRSREKAINLAEKWMLERMQDGGGLGAIFPAMANTAMALKVLGYPEDHPDYRRAVSSVDDLVVQNGSEAFCQPCVSPVWDTCLSLAAIIDAGLSPEHEAVKKAVHWLMEKQVSFKGEWAKKAPGIESGGWFFQFENDFYPDVDDTSMVMIALLKAGALENDSLRGDIMRGLNWVLGMQSSDGGWGAFDKNNNHLFLNNIPFADHGALLDPSTSDLTGRCLEMFSMLGFGMDYTPARKALKFLQKEQETWGGWFGRWGVNYLYGTCTVLRGLFYIGEDMKQPYIQKAVKWLKSCRNPDNGWGEECLSYNSPALAGKGQTTSSQTAWALLGLMAAGEEKSEHVRNGIRYLIETQNQHGYWDEKYFTGTGFPSVFYLLYRGYSRYFPITALATYRRLRFRELRSINRNSTR